MRRLLLISCALASVTTLGCAGRAELWPNSDAALQKTSTQFAADAAKRFPYKSDAPRGGQALARAEVGYFTDRVDVVNLSDSEWTNVELWINGSYVVFLPTMEAKVDKSVPFQAIFNDQGTSFPTHDGAWYKQQPLMVTKVELYRDGKLYDVPVQTAE